jgi:hypothetical protein
MYIDISNEEVFCDRSCYIGWNEVVHYGNTCQRVMPIQEWNVPIYHDSTSERKRQYVIFFIFLNFPKLQFYFQLISFQCNYILGIANFIKNLIKVKQIQESYCCDNIITSMYILGHNDNFQCKFSLLSCAPSWLNPSDFSYNVFLFTCGFFLPLTIIVLTSVSSIKCIKTVRPKTQPTQNI